MKKLTLQILFPETCRLDAEQVIEAFRSYHRSMSDVQCEIAYREGILLGTVWWGKHVIMLSGFDVPYPPSELEACVAYYAEELKQRARSHKAHVFLHYSGQEPSPFEQYVALAAAAGVMARFGAIVVLNASGHTSFPAAALSGSDSKSDMMKRDIMDLLRTLPLSTLYCGFVKGEVSGIPGVWMRTCGAPLLGLPDLAAHATGNHESERYFAMFENIFGYLRDTGARLAAGDTMQSDEEEYLRFRAPKTDEWYLGSDADLLVIEFIGPNEINRTIAHTRA